MRRTRRIRWCLLALLFSIGLYGSSCIEKSRAEKSTKSDIWKSLKDCDLTLPSLARGIDAKCGYFTAPEDWENPKGHKIKLYFAVIPARKKTTKPDPLFFFTGGPGQASTETYPQVAQAFRLINRERDIIVIDQRGTGRSNPVKCDRSMFSDLTYEPTKEQTIAWVKKCVAAFKGGLEHYTTTSSIKDFDAIRNALGYEKINIYGISYGTRIAQTYMRLFPKRIRTVIIDGVVPQEMILGWDTSINAPNRVRTWLLQRCKADVSCNKAFPKLKESLQQFEAMLKRKSKTLKSKANKALQVPISQPNSQPTTNVAKATKPDAKGNKEVSKIMSFTHPRTNKHFKAGVSWSTWALGFRLFGYSSDMIAVLPLLIDDCSKRKDPRPLLKWIVAQMESLGGALSSLENSVICAEDFPFLAAEKAKYKGDFRYGKKRVESLPILCNHWPHKPVSKDFKARIKSDIPTLILSGQYDPVTPPKFGTQVAKHLSQSLHIVVPGEGHGVIGHSCVPRLAAKMISQGSLKGIDRACVKKHRPIGFFTDFAGPGLTR